MKPEKSEAPWVLRILGWVVLVVGALVGLMLALSGEGALGLFGPLLGAAVVCAALIGLSEAVRLLSLQEERLRHLEELVEKLQPQGEPGPGQQVCAKCGTPLPPGSSTCPTCHYQKQ